jgi:hypothetical protein
LRDTLLLTTLLGREAEMGFLDKAKAAAEQAAQKAKETAEEVQTKRELGQTYGDLGKTAFDLIESGALRHEQLEPLAAKVRELQAKLAAEESTAQEQVGTPA